MIIIVTSLNKQRRYWDTRVGEKLGLVTQVMWFRSNLFANVLESVVSRRCFSVKRSIVSDQSLLTSASCQTHLRHCHIACPDGGCSGCLEKVSTSYVGCGLRIDSYSVSESERYVSVWHGA
jgi:hypothetical protein